MSMWLLQLALIVVACSFAGRLAERLGQCRVIGETAAGIILGPSVVGAISPDFYTLMFGPASSVGMLQLGDIGIVLLMFQLGLHLDLGIGKDTRSLMAPLVVALAGMALPFAGGIGLAILSAPTLATDVPKFQYIMFCGVALCVSAVPVMARIVLDLGITRHPAAKLALSAAMLTDVAGWIMLAVIASLGVVSTGPSAWVGLSGALICFLIASFLLVRLVVRPLAERATRTSSKSRVVYVVVPYLLISAWATTALGFHSAFGSLAAAILLRQVPGLKDQWDHHFDGVLRVVLLPVFFAQAGLHVSLGSLGGAAAWMWFLLFLSVAVIGKFGGSYLGARLCGLDRPHSAIVGSLMNTRGLMELIVLSIGLQAHVLPQNVYGILVFVAIVTTAMTVPFIRRFGRFAHVVVHPIDGEQTEGRTAEV